MSGRGLRSISVSDEAGMNISQSCDFHLVPCRDAETYGTFAKAALAGEQLPAMLPILGNAADAERLCASISGCRVAGPTKSRGSREPLAEILSMVPDQTAGVLIAEQGSPEAIPAAYYAAATRRRLVFSEDLSDYRDALTGAEDAMIAGPAERFTKRWLAGFLDWVQTDELAPRSLGLLTGRSEGHLSEIVAKLLAVRARHAQERFFPGPEAGPSTAMEFELIGAHGNEIHLGFREDSVLCGRRADFKTDPGGFDCGIDCPLSNRVDAATIAAATVFLMSCDGFTPSDGLAPSEFSLLFRLLDGQTAAVLAPFKHIQANEALMHLIDAMAHAGYPLGEIASILNAHTNGGALPDPGFLVLGDPNLRVVSSHGPNIRSVSASETTQGLVLCGEMQQGCRAVTITVPQPQEPGSLAVLPMSSNMRANGSYFAVGAGVGGQLDVTLFSTDAFSPGKMEIALMPAAKVADDKLREEAAALERMRLIETVFGVDDALEKAKSDFRDLLTAGSAFPRPIEAMSMQQTCLMFDVACYQRLAALRSAAADRAITVLAKRRIWISQEYGDVFPDVRRAGREYDHACTHCGNGAVVWRYTDRITNMTARNVSVCTRCGIISDTPVDCRVTAEMETVGAVVNAQVPVAVNLVNHSDRTFGASLALQVNEHNSAGVSAESSRADLELAPGAHEAHCTNLIFPERFQDDIMSVQLFLIDDDMELSFYSQKVRTVVRHGLKQPAAGSRVANSKS